MIFFLSCYATRSCSPSGLSLAPSDRETRSESLPEGVSRIPSLRELRKEGDLSPPWRDRHLSARSLRERSAISRFRNSRRERETSGREISFGSRISGRDLLPFGCIPLGCNRRDQSGSDNLCLRTQPEGKEKEISPRDSRRGGQSGTLSRISRFRKAEPFGAT